MAQVPYNPVPGQILQDIPTPEVRPNIPQAAFGGGVATAFEGLGKTIDGVGNEVFASALKLQDLANRAEVDKADAEFMRQAGLLHANFTSLKGLNAGEALPKYQEDLEAARQQIRGTIKSPAAQKMYDSTSLSTYGRTVFNGAGHAGTEVSVASRESTKERINALVGTGANTADPAMVEENRRKAVGLTHKLYQDLGRPEAASDAETVINSSMTSNHIQFLAKNNQLDDAAKKFAELGPGMTKEDYDRTQNVIRTMQHTQGAAGIVDNLLTANTDTDGNLKITVDELQQKAKELAKQQAPNDGVYPTVVVRALDSQLRQQKFAFTAAKNDNLNLISDYLSRGEVTDMHSLIGHPKAGPAYWNLSPLERAKIPGYIDWFIRSRDRATNDKAMTEIAGMRDNDQEQFLDLNLAEKYPTLSQGDIRKVNAWKKEDTKNPRQDVRVSRAMTWLKGPYGSTLDALGIRNYDRKNPEDFNHFTGLLSEALTAWQDSHGGKPASPDDVINKIAPQLFQTHTTRDPDSITGKVFGLGRSDPYFKDLLATKQFQGYRQSHIDLNNDRGLPEPTMEETERVFYRDVAQTLWGKKPDK
jgi:hypothetical protein